MSNKIQPVRGTHDFLPEEAAYYRHIVDTALSVSRTYGFGEMMTPIFEFSDVFHRTLGETSDVVSKETYSFEDRGGESLTLRPEFTAAIARAFISNGLQEQLPCKYFYAGPAFRYERPQKGRYRQFHQIGAELLGASEVQADIEVIAMAHRLLGELGLGEHITLELNSLGDSENRAHYRDKLVEYFTAHKDALSDDSVKRLEKNPLRILDSKAEQDRPIIENAPSMHEHFNETSRAFFDALRAGLDQLNIPYTINETLVRGLDYYTHTVFEFTTSALGAQGTVIAGGRYDGLIGMMGGPETAGVGWASGVERLMSLVQEMEGTSTPSLTRPIALIPLGDAAEKEALTLAYRLRNAGFVIEHGYKGNMSKRMKKANKQNACAALILGEDEVAAGTVTLRDLNSGEQSAISLDELENALTPYRNVA